jgi:hypothetical protein
MHCPRARRIVAAGAFCVRGMAMKLARFWKQIGLTQGCASRESSGPAEVYCYPC